MNQTDDLGCASIAGYEVLRVKESVGFLRVNRSLIIVQVVFWTGSRRIMMHWATEERDTPKRSPPTDGGTRMDSGTCLPRSRE